MDDLISLFCLTWVLVTDPESENVGTLHGIKPPRLIPLTEWSVYILIANLNAQSSSAKVWLVVLPNALQLQQHFC